MENGVSTSGQPDEKAILRAVRNGDAEAFAQFIQVYQSKVRLVCLGYLLNPSEADDAAQDAFIKAYQSLNSFKGDSSFSTWVCRIASNHCLDILRTRKRRQTDSLDALQEAQGDAVESFLNKAEQEAPYDTDDLQLLTQVLASLPEEERNILLLREVEEMSYEQIASKLQCSLDAVKGRLKRARARLADISRNWFDTTPTSGTSVI